MWTIFLEKEVWSDQYNKQQAKDLIATLSTLYPRRPWTLVSPLGLKQTWTNGSADTADNFEES